MKYVTSKWITESISQGKVLPEYDYCIPGLANKYGADIRKLVGKVSASSSSSSSSSWKLDRRYEVANTNNTNTRTSYLESRFHGEQGVNTSIGSPIAMRTPYVPHKNGKIHNHMDDVDNKFNERSRELIGQNERKNLDKFNNVNKEWSLYRKGITTEENPNFVQDYFRQSRLHFIGSWKTKLPYVASTIMNDLSRKNQLVATNEAQTLVQQASSSSSKRVVIHIDMDCFFVSVLIRGKDQYINKPVCVSWSEKAGSSEISSCNYPARECGITSGMFMSKALDLCPSLIALKYDFEAYEKVSEQIYRIFYSSAPVVQPVSIDEAYLELMPDKDGLAFAKYVCDRIFVETGCTASAGVGENMLLARLATKKAKPNGIHCMSSDHISYIRELPVRELPGIGWAMQRQLHERKIYTCGDLMNIPVTVLKGIYGEGKGEFLFKLCRGIDSTALVPVGPRKSIGAEVNWGVRFTSETWRQQHAEFLWCICREVSNRMLEAKVEGRMLQVKLMKKRPGVVEPKKYMGHGIADTVSASDSLRTASNSVEILYEKALPLFRRLTKDFKEGNDLRGLGVHLTKLKELYTTAGATAVPGSDFHTNTSPQKQREISSFFKTRNSGGSSSSGSCSSSNNNNSGSDNVCSSGNKSSSETNSYEKSHDIFIEEGTHDNVDDNVYDDNHDKDDNDYSDDEDNYLTKSLSDEEDEHNLLTQLSQDRDSYTRFEVHQTDTLIRFSQIDESFLDALPPEIIRELKENYTTRERINDDVGNKASVENSLLKAKYGHLLSTDQIEKLRVLPEEVHHEAVMQMKAYSTLPSSGNIDGPIYVNDRDSGRVNVKRKHVQPKVYNKHTKELFRKTQNEHVGRVQRDDFVNGYNENNERDFTALELQRYYDESSSSLTNGHKRDDYGNLLNETVYKSHSDPFYELQSLISSLISSGDDIKGDDVICIFAVIRDTMENLCSYLKGDNHDHDDSVHDAHSHVQNYESEILPLYVEQITTILGDFAGKLIRDGRCDIVVLFLKLLKNEKVVGKSFVLSAKHINNVEERAQNECYDKYRARLVLN